MSSNSIHSSTRRSFSAALVSAFLGLIQVVALAHLVPKNELALAALSGVWVGLAAHLQEGGVNAAIVQRPQNPLAILSTLYWFNLLQGVLLWGCVALTGWGMALFFGESKLVALSAVYAITLLAGGFSAQYKALLQKNFRFRSLSKIEITGAAMGFATSLLLAWQSWGAWALVTGYLMRQLTESCLIIVTGFSLFHPKAIWQPKSAAPWFKLGFSHLGERLTTHFVSQLDTLLIGKFWGAEALGAYDTFRRVIFRPAVLIGSAAEQVSFPLFSKLQSRPLLLRKAYLNMLNGLNTLLFPAYVLAIVLAEPLVKLIFDVSWLQYTDVFQWICLSAMIAVQLNPVDSLLMAKGKIQLWLQASLLLGGLTVLALTATSGQGLGFAAGALAFAQALLCCLVFFKILPGQLNVTVSDLRKSVAMPFLFCLLAALPLLLLYRQNWSFWNIGGALLFAGLYLAANKRWNNAVFNWLLNLLSGMSTRN